MSLISFPLETIFILGNAVATCLRLLFSTPNKSMSEISSSVIIFSANPFYRKISWKQFSAIYNHQFAEKLCPHSAVLFQEKITNTLAAMSLCMPDYGYVSNLKSNYTFVEDYPNLSPKILLAKSVGVHPDYRGQNLMNYLAAYAMLSFEGYYDEIIFCTMRSDNLSLRFSDALPHETSKYALFSKML